MAAAGNDRHIHIYDESTKSLVLKMKERTGFCGHSNRIFSVKFHPFDSNILVSGGWDNTVWIYDVRQRGPVGKIYGPHICGEAIDLRYDGNTLLTGSYRHENPLELWDIRKFEKF